MDNCHFCNKLLYENDKSVSAFHFNLNPKDKQKNVIFDGAFSNYMGETVSLCNVCTVKVLAFFVESLGVKTEDETYLH